MYTERETQIKNRFNSVREGVRNRFNSAKEGVKK
tara:strand:+ start:404 stop:505 length:102 start_codon:yes stop_codon:yes gene_type:complete